MAYRNSGFFSITMLISIMQFGCSAQQKNNEGTLWYERTSYNYEEKVAVIDTLKISFDNNVVCFSFKIPELYVKDTVLEFLAYNSLSGLARVKLSQEEIFRPYDYRYNQDTLLSSSYKKDTTINGVEYKYLKLVYNNESVDVVYNNSNSIDTYRFEKFRNGMFVNMFIISGAFPIIYTRYNQGGYAEYRLVKTDYSKLKVELKDLFYDW